MQNEVLATYTDQDNSVASSVVATAKGFAVNLFDLDAEEFIPIAVIYLNLAAATDYAESLVKF